MGACTIAALGSTGRYPANPVEVTRKGRWARVQVTLSNSYDGVTPGDTCSMASRGFDTTNTVRGTIVSQTGAAAVGRVFKVEPAVAASLLVTAWEQDAGGALGAVADMTDLSSVILVIDFEQDG